MLPGLTVDTSAGRQYSTRARQGAQDGRRPTRGHGPDARTPARKAARPGAIVAPFSGVKRCEACVGVFEV